MDENDVRLRERLTEVEASCKSAHKRLDKQENIIENIRSIVEEMKFMREDLNAVAEKVGELESKPAKHWYLLVTALISATASGILGFAISHLLG